MYNKLSKHVVTRENLNLVRDMFASIFPNEILYRGFDAGVDCFEKSTYDTELEYYIHYDGDSPVGISGLYSEPMANDSLWLGWFGVLEKYRNRGYGSAILNSFESECKRRGMTFARLYTAVDNNESAIHFYKNRGYSLEVYNGEYPSTMSGKVYVASKSLCETPVIPWNDKPLEF